MLVVYGRFNFNAVLAVPLAVLFTFVPVLYETLRAC